MTKLLKESELRQAAQIIKSGGTVAFRTETVYGLGADAANEEAVKKIFEAKGRPAANPLIVHFASINDIFKNFPNIDKSTKKVLKKVRTALTVILPRPHFIPALVSAGLDTVAVRVPACGFSRKFIRACGVPLAAPSANTSTRPSPTKWEHVYNDLKGKIDAILTGRDTDIGVESTVVKVLPDKILVLRLGGISTQKLAKLTRMPVEIVTDRSETKKSPGTGFKHYAPKCPLVIARFASDMPQRIQEYIQCKNAVVMCWTDNAEKYSSAVVYLGDTAETITKNLFSSIRAAEVGADVIVCEGFPDTAEFETLNERISRAAEGNYI